MRLDTKPVSELQMTITSSTLASIFAHNVTWMCRHPKALLEGQVPHLARGHGRLTRSQRLIFYQTEFITERYLTGMKGGLKSVRTCT